MRFLCDEMFGSLARWLRIMGYDTLYIKDEDDDFLIRVVKEQGRFLLTRDKEVSRRCQNALYINENGLEKQLITVIERFGLTADKRGSRCTMCNGDLIMTEKQRIRDIVPEYTFWTHERFLFCPDCGKVFWKGTHWDEIEGFLIRVGAMGPNEDSEWEYDDNLNNG